MEPMNHEDDFGESLKRVGWGLVALFVICLGIAAILVLSVLTSDDLIHADVGPIV